jgi:hypothetical protein
MKLGQCEQVTMKIVVSHLTRMQPGYICVAGIDLNSRKHVRPVLGKRLGIDLLQKYGGVFGIGAEVDLGRTHLVGAAPEVEDHQFSSGNLKLLGTATTREFWDTIDATSTADLAAIFGPALTSHGGTCAVDLNTGTASLGCFTLPAGSVLEVDAWNKIRLRLDDGTFTPSLSVTDLRLYEDDQQTPRHELIATIADRIQDEKVLLSVGLSRAWKKPGDTQPRHWLQANNLHFETDPLGLRIFSEEE